MAELAYMRAELAFVCGQLPVSVNRVLAVDLASGEKESLRIDELVPDVEQEVPQQSDRRDLALYSDAEWARAQWERERGIVSMDPPARAPEFEHCRVDERIRSGFLARLQVLDEHRDGRRVGAISIQVEPIESFDSPPPIIGGKVANHRHTHVPAAGSAIDRTRCSQRSLHPGHWLMGIFFYSNPVDLSNS